MDTVEIAIPAGYERDHLVARIERAAADAGLDVGKRMTLRTFPGSIHWHLRRAGTTGVLELTFWPSQRRVWFAVHSNRQAAWIASAIERLRATLEQTVD
jgi:hypothetical protein